MRGFVSGMQEFIISEDGPTAVEYAVMLGLIIVVCASAISSVGSKTASIFAGTASQIP